MTSISFRARGKPVPQGGLTAYNRGSRAVLTHKRRPELEAWRHAIGDEARRVMGDRPLLAGPVLVVASFDMDRPKGHYGTGRNAGILRAGAPTRPVGKPDIDKLERALLDALTGVAFIDDAQVVATNIQKRYGAADLGPGVYVTVTALDE